MAKRIVKHLEYGPVLLDTLTSKFEYITTEDRLWFSRDGKKVRYFDNVGLFLDSNVNIAVVPAVCSMAGHKGRRTFIEVIDWNNYNYKLFNVEMINYKWVKNKINYVQKSKCYFVLLQRNIYALNDFILLSALEIKRGVNNTPLL